SRIRMLILPYLAFAAVSILCWKLFGPGRADSGSVASLSRVLIGAAAANNAGIWPEINRALWFFPCLFVAENIFYFLEQRIRESFLPVTLALLAAAGYAGSLFIPYGIPWGAEIALTGAVFYGLGFLVRRRGLHASFSELSASRSALVFLLLAVLFFQTLNGRVDMSENRLGNFFCFYSAALTGAAFCTLAAFRLEHHRMLRFLGRHALPIFGLHLAVAPVVCQMLFSAFHISFASVRYSVPLGALLASSQVALIVCLIQIIHRGIPLHRIRIPAFPLPAIDRARIYRAKNRERTEPLPVPGFPHRLQSRERLLALPLRFGPDEPIPFPISRYSARDSGSEVRERLKTGALD
ncbi:MAG TPA: acyltransferase family protein, partial [Armatimonadota bacterium]|nr:acyltransferase family protein [Armatimonadota bacterium]